MINRKKFNSLVQDSIKDFETYLNLSESKIIVKNLKNIIKTKYIKDMSLNKVLTLIELILVTEIQPLNYGDKEVLHHQLAIRNEHKLIKEYLEQYFVMNYNYGILSIYKRDDYE